MKKKLFLLPLCLMFLLSISCITKLYYYPTRYIYQTPADYHLTYEEVFFNSKDGTQLSGWFIHAVGKPVGTVIHFHGNAQNMTAHFSFVDWLPNKGFNLFVFDYRGYGQSDGHPEPRGVYEDSVAAIQYVMSRTDIDTNKLFVLGQSIGGANAIAAIGQNSFKGIRAIAIESCFYSYHRMAQDVIGRIPLLGFFKKYLSKVIVSNDYSPSEVIDKISPISLLLIHGTYDDVVPYHHSQLLFKQAKEPKLLWTIEGGYHTEALTRFGDQYKDQLTLFYKNTLQKQGI